MPQKKKAKKLTFKQRVAGVERRAKNLRPLKSAKAVAEFLAKRKIKGVPGDSESCPLARYLNFGCEVFGGVAGVEGDFFEGEEANIKIGPGCRQFVHKFDDGEFPDLEE